MSNSLPFARLALALALAVPAAVHAGPKEEAQAHIIKATEAHQRSDYEAALAELEAAYALDPQPDLLYAIGQVYLKLERCPDAISYYERYLATAPTLEAAGQAQEAIDACKAKLPPPPPEPQPLAPPPPPPPPPPATAWYKDPVGGALVGGGVVAGVLGVVFYASARGSLDDAEAAPTLPEYQDHVDSARTKRLVSVVLIGGGAALIGGGIWRYMTRDAATREARQVGVVPTSDGGMITWKGDF